LLQLEYPSDRLDLIVVDDGSTDSTALVLGQYGEQIRVFRARQGGPAAARNVGIRNARGEWIAFTDADCVVEPDWLVGLLSSPPAAESDIGIIGGRILSVEPCNRIERFGEQIHDHGRAIQDFQPPYAISMNWASRRNVLEGIGLFDETLRRGEDVDLAWRIQQAGFRLIYRPSAVIRHINERTFGGLFREGFRHGRARRWLVAKHREATSGAWWRLAAERRIVRGALQRVRGENRFDALCALVFDLGKLIGQRIPTGRSTPRGRKPKKRSQLELLREIASAQLKLRDESTVLGFLWSFLNPLLLLGMLYLIFRTRLGAGIVHYPVFLLIGIIHYTHFSKTTSTSMRSLHSMRGLATNVILPKEVLVFSSVLTGAYEFLISMVIALLIALLAGVAPSAALLALPVVLVIQLSLTLWIALVLSCLWVYVRDIDNVYAVALRLLFFATPIFYDLDFLDPALRRLVLLNPLTHLIGASREIILFGRVPDEGIMIGFLLLNVLLTFAALVLFRRMEPSLIERL
jgi:ABC-type polysaccharide/polyol phosphate export permease/GT2 family glycosyltransferase